MSKHPLRICHVRPTVIGIEDVAGTENSPRTYIPVRRKDSDKWANNPDGFR